MSIDTRLQRTTPAQKRFGAACIGAGALGTIGSFAYAQHHVVSYFASHSKEDLGALVTYSAIGVAGALLAYAVERNENYTGLTKNLR
jgi:hypothetical protein